MVQPWCADRRTRLRLGRMFGRESLRQRVAGACRQTVFDTARALREAHFTEQPVRTCPVSALPMTLACSDADHAPPWTFANILNAWLRQAGVDHDCSEWPDGELEQHHDFDGSRFSDEHLAGHFKAFHDERAQLRVVHSFANRIFLPAWQRAAESFEE